MIVVLMGVTGSGKTFIGKLLAKCLGIAFADADDYHSAANKQKMAAGHPLTDEDRQPWLETLNDLLKTWNANGESGVLACSALKEDYRQILKAGLTQGDPHFVWLDVPVELLTQRLAHRHHEYMNPALLGSQIATLEAPADALRIVNDGQPDAVVQEIIQKLPPLPK